MFGNMKIGAKLAIGFGSVLALLLGIVVYGLSNVAELNSGIHLVVEDRMVKTRQANDVVAEMNTTARALRNAFLMTDSAAIKTELGRIQDATLVVKAKLDSLEESIKSEEGKKHVAAVMEARNAYVPVREKTIDLAKSGKRDEALALLMGDQRKLYNDYLEKVTDLIDFQTDLANKDGEDAAAMAGKTRTMLMVLAGSALGLGLLLAFIITTSITGPMRKVMDAAEKISRGDVDVDVSSNATDEVGRLMQTMAKMVAVLKSLISDMKHMSSEHDRGEIDAAMVPEKFDGAFKEMAKGVNDMVFGHIAVKKKAMACVKSFGEGDFDAPLEKFPGKKVFINDTIEQVRTNLKALIADASMLSKAAVEGRLSTRADASKHQGDFRKIVAGVNDTLDAVIGPLNVAAKYVDDISKGNIPAKITDTYNGDFNTLKNNLNTCVEAVNALVADAGLLVKAAVEGRLQTRADASKHNGDFRKIVQGVNETLDAVIGPVNEAAQVLEKVAARDLTARMLGNYAGDLAKIKNSLNLAVENLETAMGQVGEATQQVASASGQISSGSQSLAQGANEQASSLEEVSASLEEMSSMTRQNADNALAAKNLAGEADGNAKVGTEAMARMSRSINRIKESSDQTAKIVKTIDEIAMQTNLLALNAAVEAARAGEAGRGFAVVAEEVRNLAQRSAQAAKNTADMIGESVKNAEEGVKISDEVSVSFEKIAQSSKKVNDLIAEIAAASKEQSTGIKEVNDAVGQMDKVTQQNAANAEESASASEELSSQAQELQAMVAQFKITGGNSTRPKAIAHAKRPALPPPSSHHKAPGPKSAKLVSSDEMIPMDDDALREF
ncbi:MAG: hypothetical protein RL173_226 [Fibrobacterota bacterium]|jgi:methyl-accepting chemotaxis protein